MQIRYLKELLGIYPDDLQVLIQTTPDDLCAPITLQHLSMLHASHCEKYGLEPAKLLLTAYRPTSEYAPPAKSHAQRAAMADLIQDIERGIDPKESGTLAHAKESMA